MKITKDRRVWGEWIALVFLGSSPAAFATPTDYVMDVQMVPALCSLYPEYAKKRKCLEGYSLNIAGLYPQTTSQDCSTNSSAKLPPLQSKVVARIMPDENTRTVLWRNIGGCVPMNASQYFRTIINYADRIKVPAELTEQENITISVDALRMKFVKINPKLPASALRFHCQQTQSASVLTSIKVCYAQNGNYKSCPANIINTCPKTVTIKGTY